MMPRRRSVAALPALLLLVMTLAGCASHAPSSAAFMATGSTPYHLASGDKLRVIVFGQDNLSNIYSVDGAGRITMPLIGPVPVSGETTQQAAVLIGARLRNGFIRDPKVTVEIEAYRPFFILGEVTNAGQFPFVNGMTAQTAVAIAGGFSPRAAKDYAEITRATGDRTLTASVPITTPLRPGDTVVIKERWF
jgi:polysaccharide export outer membrane protein